jgi:hypothetical protein
MALGPSFPSQGKNSSSPIYTVTLSPCYHGPAVPVTSSCGSFNPTSKKRETSIPHSCRVNIPFFPCQLSQFFAFICPIFPLSLHPQSSVFRGTARALDISGPSRAQNSAPPPSRWHVSFDLPPLSPPSIFCPRQIIVWLGSLDHLGLEVQRRISTSLALWLSPFSPLFPPIKVIASKLYCPLQSHVARRAVSGPWQNITYAPSTDHCPLPVSHCTHYPITLQSLLVACKAPACFMVGPV